MSDNSRTAATYTTANAPRTNKQATERTDQEAEPPSSNSWVAMTPQEGPEVERVVAMTSEDQHHMREDLGRDPQQLVQQQAEAEAEMGQRQQQLRQAAPGNNIAEMAAGAPGPEPARHTADEVTAADLELKTHEVTTRKETAT